MKKKGGITLLLVSFISLICFNACTSTTALRAYEVIDQTYRANAEGTYLGTANSYERARSMAANGGYSRFEWYSSTGLSTSFLINSCKASLAQETLTFNLSETLDGVKKASFATRSFNNFS